MKMVVTPVFQPILDLKTKQIGWLEALARINGDFTQRGHIQLLSLGEECGFIHHIDEAVTERVLELRENAGVPIAINVSVMTIERKPATIIDMLRKHPGAARDLILEITETVQIIDMRAILEFCMSIRKLGVRIAVDDFGTGFFTPELVHEIRPDYIKLAQELVSTVVSTRDLSLLLDITAVASDIGAEMVAEGIDSPKKMEMLGVMGCRYAQGFQISRPLPISKVWNHPFYPPPVFITPVPCIA